MWMIIFKNRATEIKYSPYDVADVMDDREDEIISIVNIR